MTCFCLASHTRETSFKKLFFWVSASTYGFWSTKVELITSDHERIKRLTLAIMRVLNFETFQSVLNFETLQSLLVYKSWHGPAL